MIIASILLSGCAEIPALATAAGALFPSTGKGVTVQVGWFDSHNSCCCGTNCRMIGAK